MRLYLSLDMLMLLTSTGIRLTSVSVLSYLHTGDVDFDVVDAVKVVDVDADVDIADKPGEQADQCLICILEKEERGSLSASGLQPSSLANCTQEK